MSSIFKNKLRRLAGSRPQQEPARLKYAPAVAIGIAQVAPGINLQDNLLPLARRQVNLLKAYQALLRLRDGASGSDMYQNTVSLPGRNPVFVTVTFAFSPRLALIFRAPSVTLP